MVLLKKIRQKCDTHHRNKRDREATERALLMAAHKLFAEKGYENTRTLEIAKEAGVNEALIARYYGGKEGLLVSVLKNPEWNDELVPENCFKVDLGPSSNKLSSVFEEFFKNSGEKMALNESFMRISTSRALVDESVADSMRKNIMDRRLPELEEGLKVLTKRSKLSQEELQALTMLLGSNNFSLNFLGKVIYKMSPKKVSLALKILSESLENYIKSKE